MTDEILNIDFHVKQLLLKALNKHGKSEKAATVLGISLKTLHNYVKDYQVTKVANVFVSLKVSQVMIYKEL